MNNVFDLSTPAGRQAMPEGWTWSPVAGFAPATDGRSVEDSIAEIRQVRRLKIEAVLWAVERHQREMRLGRPTTLTPAEARALDEYVQALCDFPATLDPEATVPRGDVVDGLPWPRMPDAMLHKVLRRDGGFA